MSCYHNLSFSAQLLRWKWDVGWTGHDRNHILAFYQIFSSKVFKHTFTGNEGKVWLWEKSVEFGWRLSNFTRFKPKLNFSVLSNISIHQHSVATRLRKMKQIKKRMNCRSCTMVHPQRVGNHNIFSNKSSQTQCYHSKIT